MRRRAVFVCGIAWVSACVSSTPAREPESSSPTPAPPPVVIVEPSPSGRVAPTAESEGASSEPAVVSTGIPECDEYLALYQRCEEHLQPQIMAGERRFYKAEQASLVHYAGQPGAETMSGSCRTLA